MAIKRYAHPRILVDLGDHPTANIKLRARRVYVNLPDDTERPCLLQVELIPYERLENGDYGAEYIGGVFTRKMCRPLVVDNNRLVDTRTGLILASRYAANNTLRPDSEWLAEEARIKADDTLEAMYQADWFNQLMDEGMPEPIRAFIVHYIQLAWASGDLV